MYLKKLTFFVVVTAVTVWAAVPVSAETPSEYYNRRLELQKLDEYRAANNRSFEANRKHEASVDNLYQVAEQNKKEAARRLQEADAKMQELGQREAAVRQAEEQLVQRRYYWWDPLAGVYYGIYLDCYPWWTPPVWWGWSLWTPYSGYPIYGWVGGCWRNNRVVVNNYYISQPGFNQTAFSNNFNHRFGRTQFNFHQRGSFSPRNAGFHRRGPSARRQTFSGNLAPNRFQGRQPFAGRSHNQGFGQQRQVYRGQSFGSRGRNGMIAPPWANQSANRQPQNWRRPHPGRQGFAGRGYQPRSAPRGNQWAIRGGGSPWVGGHHGSGHAPQNWGNRGSGHASQNWGRGGHSHGGDRSHRGPW